MKALGRSLQEPPFLQGCARHSSVSVQTGGGTDSYGDLLHVPQDSICSLMISKALRPQCLGLSLSSVTSTCSSLAGLLPISST